MIRTMTGSIAATIRKLKGNGPWARFLIVIAGGDCNDLYPDIRADRGKFCLYDLWFGNVCQNGDPAAKSDGREFLDHLNSIGLTEKQRADNAIGFQEVKQGRSQRRQIEWTDTGIRKIQAGRQPVQSDQENPLRLCAGIDMRSFIGRCRHGLLHPIGHGRVCQWTILIMTTFCRLSAGR